jgi:hypothetical protein
MSTIIPLLNNADTPYAGPVPKRSRKKQAKRGRGRPKEIDDAVSVTFDMERSQSEALREVAEEKGVSVASLIRRAIGSYLRRLGRS